MQNRSSLVGGVALGVLLAAAMGPAAQAKPHHHHAAAAAAAAAAANSALAAKVETLTDAVSTLENQLNQETQAQQATQAEADAAKADAAQARADASAAQQQLAEQIQTIPGEVGTAIAAAAPKAPPVKVTLGGFSAFETVTRTKSEISDIGSKYPSIPYPNSTLAHVGETRFTGRQSRLSVLMQANVNPTTHAAFYGEFDFLAEAQTGNSNESNSYSPRIRNLYGSVDWDDWGLHLLGGQSWSLATLNSKGITPRAEVIPPTIEAQYVPGFVWARQPQIRLVKDFNKEVWVAVSLENPQTAYGSAATGSSLTPSTVVPTTVAAGISLLNPSVNFSFNHVPDVIGKVAYEPMIDGRQPLHVEVFGIYRDYYDRVAYESGNPFVTVPPATPNPACYTGGTPAVCANKESSGGGFGAGVTLNVVPKVLDIQGSTLIGQGIGRYGSGQLPDVVVGPDGTPKPIPETMFLVGGTLHALPTLDLYVMYGQERESRVLSKVGTTLYGYGNPLAGVGGCLEEGFTCSPDTQQIDQITAGLWDKAYTGPWGSLRIGLQYSHTNLTAFPGLTGSSTAGKLGTSYNTGSPVRPTTSDDMFFTSFRFYPSF